ncbi:puratrophin-1-like isoform X2 [Neocloeon triangulifer]|uniref:puratrophin-1-like isoform X2 n=1 Tax=Neocloeon triangulifer TaxID=2078957 RepID=UPI00286F37DE|nr:puratrophin-1-like isoform X2 [Neocloeon triangulifer]
MSCIVWRVLNKKCSKARQLLRNGLQIAHFACVVQLEQRRRCLLPAVDAPPKKPAAPPKKDLADLLSSYLAPFFAFYDALEPVLEAEARILCKTHFGGDLDAFETLFLRPAAQLLHQKPKWLAPLEATLGGVAVILVHIGEAPDASFATGALHCCLRPSSFGGVEASLTWRGPLGQLRRRPAGPLAPMTAPTDSAVLLVAASGSAGNVAIRPAPLHLLERIPHIDSDDDEPPPHTPPPPPQNTGDDQPPPAAPTAASQLPAGLLSSGFFALADTEDCEGAAVVVAGGSREPYPAPRQAGQLLTYLALLVERRWKFEDNESNPPPLTLYVPRLESTAVLDLIDRSLFAAQGYGTRVERVVVRRQPGGAPAKSRRILPISKVKLHVVGGDGSALRRFFPDGSPPVPAYPERPHLWAQLLQEAEEVEAACSGADRLQTASELQQRLSQIELRAQNEACPFLRIGLKRAAAAVAAVRQAERPEAVKRLQQELSWFDSEGERSLADLLAAAEGPPEGPPDPLGGNRFHLLYLEALRHMERASDLAEEAAGGHSDAGGGTLSTLARSLKQHLRGFGGRLEEARERFEDAHRCLALVAKAEEWAAEADSRLREADEKALRLHVMAHPAPCTSHLAEMAQLARKLRNAKLADHCLDAESRCLATMETVRNRLSGAAPFSANCSCWPEPQTPAWPDEEGSSSVASVASDDQKHECTKEEEVDAAVERSPLTPNAHLEQLQTPPLEAIDPAADPNVAKTQRTLLLIMREMIQTERDYVRALEYVIEHYIPELLRDDIPQALRGQRNVVFGNIEKICEFHRHFFLLELEKCEKRPLAVANIFLKYEDKFYLYALYNKNKPKSDCLLIDYGAAFFRAKQLELGDKMDLASYLLKPVQRMGKYALLLQQMLKQAAGGQAADLAAAEAMVRFQLRHGNDLLAMDSLTNCDVNLKEQGRLLRQNEFIVNQGPRGRKCVRHVFLFEELILFSKARKFPDRKNLDLFVYKSSIKMTDIGLTALVADAPNKFEIWFRKRKPSDTFTLYTSSSDIKAAWTKEISTLLWKQALRNREVRLAEMSSMGIGNKPCLDIRPSGDQISDRSIGLTQLAKAGARFRSSVALSSAERRPRRPHSVVSVASSSSSSAGSNYGSGENSTMRSNTLNSHSSLESGIISDLSASLEESWPPEAASAATP